MKHIIAWLLLSGVLISCEDGEVDGPNLQDTALKASQLSQFKTANFGDADWLYQNYFGEYNLPAAFKDSIIDELKRVANSFVLYSAQVGNSQQVMIQMNAWAREMLSRKEVQASIKSAFVSYDAVNIEAIKQADLAKMQANGIRPLTDAEEAQRMQEKEAFEKLHNPSFYAYMQSQKALVDTYGLPYPLTRSSTKVYATFRKVLENKKLW